MMLFPFLFLFASTVSAESIFRNYYSKLNGNGIFPPKKKTMNEPYQDVQSVLGLCYPQLSHNSLRGIIKTEIYTQLNITRLLMADCVEKERRQRVWVAWLNMFHWSEGLNPVPEMCETNATRDRYPTGDYDNFYTMMRLTPICHCSAQSNDFCGEAGGEDIMSEQFYSMLYLVSQIQRNHPEPFECENAPDLNPDFYTVKFDYTNYVAGGLNCTERGNTTIAPSTPKPEPYGDTEDGDDKYY